MPPCRKGSHCIHLYNLAGLPWSCKATHFVKCHTKCIPWDGMYHGVPTESTSSHHSCAFQCFFVVLVWKTTTKKGQKYQDFYSSNSPCTETKAWYFPKFLKRRCLPIPKSGKTKSPITRKFYKPKLHIRTYQWSSLSVCTSLYSFSINSTLKPKLH